MKEVVFDYEEFKAKVDATKPLHHHAWHKPLDEHGIIHKLVFKIHGISKNGGHIIVFEWQERVSALNIPDKYRKSHNAFENLHVYFNELYKELCDKYAKPLGSTIGRWES